MIDQLSKKSSNTILSFMRSYKYFLSIGGALSIIAVSLATATYFSKTLQKLFRVNSVINYIKNIEWRLKREYKHA